MVSKKIEFHEAASLELEAAFDWYLERSEPAAMRFLSEMDEAIATTSETPKRSPESGFGTRKFLLQRFPFALFYRELPSSVQVVAVAHGHRRPGYWKNRL